MKCTNAEFLANASALMRKAEEAEEALEICGDDGEVRMVCSVPGFRSNVIRKARPVDAVVSFFRFRPDKPLPKGWDHETLWKAAPVIRGGQYVVWANGSSIEVMSEKDFEKRYVRLEDWE